MRKGLLACKGLNIYLLASGFDIFFSGVGGLGHRHHHSQTRGGRVARIPARAGTPAPARTRARIAPAHTGTHALQVLYQLFIFS